MEVAEGRLLDTSGLIFCWIAGICVAYRPLYRVHGQVRKCGLRAFTRACTCTGTLRFTTVARQE